jgi:hypothetical protein
MALSITHSYVSAVPDAGDASLVQPSDWNDTHDISGLGTGVETFLGTPSSANLASAVTDETGSGALVFANTPTLVTPVLGAATGTSIVLSGKIEAASIELGHASANTLTASGGVLSIEGVALLSTASVIPLTIGTSTIASGTDTRILYNNAGVLGQYTLTGTGTVVAMQTAPSFLTSITTPIATITQGTITDVAPQINGTVTWDDAADTFTAWKLNVTNTNSASDSLLLDLQVGGTTRMKAAASGTVYIKNPTGGSNQLVLGTLANDTGGVSFLVNGGTVSLYRADQGVSASVSCNDINLTQINLGGSNDIFFNRLGAGHLKITSDGGTTYNAVTISTVVTPRKSELTIASDAITVTGGYHDVDTEADAASDDLATINGGTDGMRLVLRANNSGRTVVVKDGTGNIQCAGDMSLDNIQDTIELIYDGVQTAWLEIGRSDNGA